MELNPGYKQTEVGLIPADWEVIALGEICATSSGTTPARDLADRYYRNGSIQWVKTLDLNNSEIRETDELVTPAAMEETSLRSYPVGTILVAMYGGFNQIGRTGLLRIPASVNQAITAIQPRISKLLPEFLLASLNFKVGYWKAVASSSRKDPNITSQDIRLFPVTCPGLAEQRSIGAALSDVDALLTKLDQFIAKKRDLKQATMQQLLTGQTRLPGFSGEWEVKRLGRLLDFQVGYPFKSDFFNQESNGIRLIKNADLKGDDQVFFYSGQFDQAYIVNNEDLLVGMDGDFLPCRWTKGPALLNQRVGRILPNKALHAGYAYFRLASILKDIECMTSATTVKHLSHRDIERIECAMPQHGEQAAIAAILSDMDADLAALESRRDKTRALKQGMMQELLTGCIRLV